MDNCQCQGIEIEAGNWLDSNLGKYRAGNFAATTRMLLEALSGYEVGDRVFWILAGAWGHYSLNCCEQA